MVEDDDERPRERKLVVVERGDAAAPALERLEQALARAETPQALINVAAVAEAARRLSRRLYQRARHARSEQNAWALIRLRALRRLGALLAAMPKNPGAATRLHHVTALPPTLADLNISKRDSARWQRLACVPEGLFRQHCNTITERGGQLSEASFHTLLRRLDEDEESERGWTLDEAVRRLRRLLDAVLQRCRGSELREALAGTLRALAKEIEDTITEGGCAERPP